MPIIFYNAQFLKCMCFELKFSLSLNLTYCISIWYFQLFTMYFEFSAFLIQTNYLYKKLKTMKCHTLRKLLIKGSSKIKQVNAEDGGVIFKNRGVYYNSFKIFLFWIKWHDISISLIYLCFDTFSTQMWDHGI